ncbi:WxL domain-containing protein [Enterococcus thailandicus]|uniref:WxL domain-containing protein n=1 Tax=Enterococcus thailandicus TaxID=417368 RepID=UPI0022EBD32D|nr:WxL domain-containing protein [Enterococcus thailandicus]MDA3972744.1 WxL domain-containing protein [Enterococcus thailandicus]MDA3975240.1 WxL domain-containing protein [Enterococcus thailandicus]MDA3980204.1 WxL domain-containing protein [Enterococcus thailandicus]
MKNERNLAITVIFSVIGMVIYIVFLFYLFFALPSSGIVAYAIPTESVNKLTVVDGGTVNPSLPVDPQKPLDPPETITPEVPVNPGTGGSLSIDYISPMNFGNHPIPKGDIQYISDKFDYTNNVTNAKQTYFNMIQVTDVRGTGSGWSLTLKQNGQFKTSTNTILQNAQLQLTMSKKRAQLKIGYPINAQVINPNGTETQIMGASSGLGIGITQLHFLAKLEIPQSTMKLSDEYKTTFTWSLKDVPSDLPVN